MADELLKQAQDIFEGQIVRADHHVLQDALLIIILPIGLRRPKEHRVHFDDHPCSLWCTFFPSNCPGMMED